MNLLERESALALLESTLQEARAGEGRIVLVSGEAGIGKTSLVENFVRSHKEMPRVLWGSCDQLFTPRPLGILHDLAAQIGSDMPHLLSEMAASNVVLPAMLAKFQRKLALVTIEDVQWADEGTFDFLRYLARRINQTAILLIITYRDDEFNPTHPLRLLLGDLVASPATRRIKLQPLSLVAVRKLIGTRSLDPVSLHHQTAGNPFFVTEVLANEDGGIPHTIQDAVLARSARLSKSGWAVLEAAAVIGMRIESWLLVEVSGADAFAIVECFAAGILQVQGEWLVFRHELVRQTILAAILPRRSHALNRLVLQSLRASPDGRKELARLAYHAERSAEYQAVLEYAPAAAIQASNAGAHREAYTLYRLVLLYARHLPPDEHTAILEAYARECNLTEHQVDALNALQEAVKICRENQNFLKQGEMLAFMAIILRNQGQNPQAAQSNHLAISLLEPLPQSRELALAYRVQATLLLASSDYQAAIQWGERAIALAQEFNAANVLAIAKITVGSAWLFLDFDRGKNYLEALLPEAVQSWSDRYTANLYIYMGSCAAELYQFHLAESYLTQGIAFTIDRRLDLLTSFMQAWLAITYFYLGHWEKATDLTLLLSRKNTQTTFNRIPTLVASSLLMACQGQPGVDELLDEALRLAEEAGTLPLVGAVRAARAEVAWLSGDLPRTTAEATAAYELAVSKRHSWFTGKLAYWLWRAGVDVVLPDWVANPYALQIAGDWQSFAAAWERLGCTYLQAVALSDGDETARFSALSMFEKLGALPLAQKLRNSIVSPVTRCRACRILLLVRIPLS